MKLIREEIQDVQYITEEHDGKKKLFIEGIFMQANVKNRNGRIYPSHVMENEVRRYVKEKVAKGCAYGELGHPNGPQINLDRVCHVIKELKMSGNDVHGKALVINEGMGKIVHGLIEAGANLGVSSRGLGSLKPVNGIMEVQDDFKICAAADMVSDPSGPDCWVQGIMENVEYFYDSEGLIRAAEVSKNEIKKMSSRELEEAKYRLFENYLKLI